MAIFIALALGIASTPSDVHDIEQIGPWAIEIHPSERLCAAWSKTDQNNMFRWGTSSLFMVAKKKSGKSVVGFSGATSAAEGQRLKFRWHGVRAKQGFGFDVPEQELGRSFVGDWVVAYTVALGGHLLVGPGETRVPEMVKWDRIIFEGEKDRTGAGPVYIMEIAGLSEALKALDRCLTKIP